MSDRTTNFPPQTYSSSFYLNSMVNDEDNSAIVSHEEISNGEKDNPILDCFIATMACFGLTFLLLAYSVNYINGDNKIVNCGLDNSAKIRTFSTLQQYQGNRLSFSSTEPGYEGNYVQFSFISISRLPKNAFIAKKSSYIKKIILDGKGIAEIEAGAFTSLICLRYLDLNRNNITSLTANTFKELLSLEVLELSGNKLETLPEVAFGTLMNLKVLDVSKNKLNTINNLAFFNQTNLKVLNLGFNQLRIISFSVFNPLTSLEELNLEFNSLKTVEAEKWNLPRLQKLNIAGNGLVSFDMSYNFTFTKLSSLNLSSNHLSQLNILGLKRRLFNLSSIDIDQNRWVCSNLEQIGNSLKAMNIAYAKLHVTSKEASVDGVKCYDPLRNSYERTTHEVPSSTISEVNNNNYNTSLTYVSKTDMEHFQNNYEKIKNHTDSIIQHNEEILHGLSYLKNVLNFIIVLVFISAFVYILRHAGLCRNCGERLIQGRNGTHLENVVLIRRES